jgi:hypothetical protein
VKFEIIILSFAGVRLKACVFIGLAVHALIYILLIFKFDLYRGACGGGRSWMIAEIFNHFKEPATNVTS